MAHNQNQHEKPKNSFHLTFLANHPHFVPIVAQWIYDEWGHQDPENSLEKCIARQQSRLNTKNPPIALVGLLDGKPIACSSIKIRELESFPQYMHWLGSIYVLSEFRNQGIGSAVVELSTQFAAMIGLGELYLYTHSHEDFYNRLGFTQVKRPLYQGRKIVIMKKQLV
jgi:N-acetylglutamate synthase-like GNAT family acetyltransferase